MSTSSYHTAWLIYLLGASGAILVFWILTAHWPAWIRPWVRALPPALLLTPYASDPDQQVYAPAFLICLFESAFGDPELGWHAARPLIAVTVACLVLALLTTIVARKSR